MLSRLSLINQQGVWSSDDLDKILRGYGAFIVERTGTDIGGALESLQLWKDTIHVRIIGRKSSYSGLAQE
jgi:nicotinamide mononucleotide adenylyltransferase